MNKLYQEYYPNILSTFWAYYLARLNDNENPLPMFIHEKYSVKAFTSPDIFVDNFCNDPLSISIYRTLSLGLSESLETCFYEFMFLITGQDQLYIQKERQNYITPKIEEKYLDFATDPKIKEVFFQALGSIVVDHESKMYDSRFPKTVDENDPLADVYKRGISGAHTGAREVTWAHFIQTIMSESFSPRSMARVIASVDMKDLRHIQVGLGSERPEEMGDETSLEALQYEPYSLIEVDEKRGISSNTIVENRGPKTHNCPGLRGSDEEFTLLIKEKILRFISSPNYIAGESIIEGLSREVQKPLRSLLDSFTLEHLELMREYGLEHEEYNILRGIFPTETVEDRAGEVDVNYADYSYYSELV